MSEQFHDIRRHLQLYLVMGSTNCKLDPFLVLQEAIAGGITMFQFREKGPASLQGNAKLELGKRLRRLCGQHGIPFIVNDDVELALQLDADGIHIGQEDDPAFKVRERMKDRIVGVSTHDPEEAKAALSEGADYLGVGPMYPTLTKLDAREVQGPSMITAIRQQGVTAPLVGIGGIVTAGAGAVMQAGADGIAVVSAVSQSASPKEAARQLREELSKLIHR